MHLEHPVTRLNIVKERNEGFELDLGGELARAIHDKTRIPMKYIGVTDAELVQSQIKEGNSWYKSSWQCKIPLAECNFETAEEANAVFKLNLLRSEEIEKQEAEAKKIQQSENISDSTSSKSLNSTPSKSTKLTPENSDGEKEARSTADSSTQYDTSSILTPTPTGSDSEVEITEAQIARGEVAGEKIIQGFKELIRGKRELKRN